MSHTLNDPHGTKSDGPVAKSNKQDEALREKDLKGQWARCRAAGLTIHIHAPESIFGERDAWIKADDVELMLEAYGKLLREIEAT